MGKNLSVSDNLINGFLHSVQCFPERPALWVKGKFYSYAELYEEVAKLAVALKEYPAERCLVYAGRTAVAYIGILAALFAGKTYVPMRPRIPHERNLLMLNQVDTDLMVVDNQSIEQASALLAQSSKKMRLFLPDTNIEFFKEAFFAHDIADRADINKHPVTTTLSIISHNPYAYLLFTSGSTGLPKGVPVKHTNIVHYIKAFIERACPNEQDRFTQLADLTFDFSVHDCFPAWTVGACVYSFSDDYFPSLAEYITRNELTFWGSVPSMAMLINKLKRLKPNHFPSLRYSMFCGEPFSEHMARLWSKIAPNSIIENFYGPTEAAVCFTAYQWSLNTSINENSIVSIGKPFLGLEVMLVDNDLKEVAHGCVGEMLLSGPQVVDQYWKNDLLTSKAFLKLPDGNGEIRHWYRTGDMAVFNSKRGYLYKGRCDDQIQIRGSRVEKLEIELAIKEAAKTNFVAVLPWPCAEDGTIFGVIAYIVGAQVAKEDIVAVCRKKFPDYMVPNEIHFVNDLPYNMNGKLDYRALKSLREQQEGRKYGNH